MRKVYHSIVTGDYESEELSRRIVNYIMKEFDPPSECREEYQNEIQKIMEEFKNEKTEGTEVR